MAKKSYIIFTLLLMALVLAHNHGKGNSDNVIFKNFPQTAEYFKEDIDPHIDQIIKNHGIQEWKLVVMTSEFHTHLGIYSILGAKMGLKAREYFGCSKDQLTVLTYAGIEPPLSCLNDGLQMSTGATLGQGTIHMADGDNNFVKAEITYQDSTIIIELKENYQQQIKNDIRKIIETHGLQTISYWQKVRNLGIQYWKEWSRDEIFVIHSL